MSKKASAVKREPPHTALERFAELVFAEPVPILVLDPEAGGIKGEDELVTIRCRDWSELERCQRRVETGDYRAPRVGLSPNMQLLAFIAQRLGLLVDPKAPQTEAGKHLKTFWETGIPLGRTATVEVRAHTHINHCGFVMREEKGGTGSVGLCGAESVWRFRHLESPRELCDKHKEIVETSDYGRGVEFERIVKKTLIELVLAQRNCRVCEKGAEAVLRYEFPEEKDVEDPFCMKHAMQHAEDKLKLGYRVTLLTKDSAPNWPKKGVQAPAREDEA